MNDIKIYITFDIDQDFSLNSSDYYNRTSADFKSFEIGFSKVIDLLKGMPFSVFIRSDYQIKSIYGSYDYLISKNQSLIDRILMSNGELNWHIHLYKEEEYKWIQIADNNEIVDSFLRDFEEVKKIPLLNHKIVRIGECVMNNSLMKEMDRMGILIDSTALPGRKRDDSEKKFDWSLTDNGFYHPSAVDYRVPGIQCYKINEIPLSTLYMKSNYDSAPIRRYFNPAFKTEILFQNFEEYINIFDNLVTITHPFEILNSGQHGLISFDIHTFSNNLEFMKDNIFKSDKNPVFRRISQIIENE